jgi:hypothetical protein
MFGSRSLEVVIGIIFIFLLVSIICSAVREVIESLLKSRAAYLEYGIRELLHDRDALGLARNLYEHPLIWGLYGGGYTPGKVGAHPPLLAKGGNLPSYIPTRNFALALMDIAARGAVTDAVSGDPESPVVSVESIRRNVQNLGNVAVQRVLLSAIDASQDDLDRTRLALEAWYDSAMDRVSGWYKRSTSWVIFWIGLAVAIALNVNTITVADYLYRNDAARAALVARAQTAVTDTGYLHRSYAEAKAGLDSAGLPVGWDRGWGAPRPASEHSRFQPWNDLFAPIFGVLFTALAATMGAPFWFDLLNKITVVRSTVKPHEKSPEEPSEDGASNERSPAGTSTIPSTVSAARPVASSTASSSAATGLTLANRQTPRDAESGLDGCDVEMSGATVVTTRDEDLPEAEGGVS